MSTEAPSDSAEHANGTIDQTLASTIVRELNGRFRGVCIHPDHPDYEASRRVWNAMVDKRPGLILRCTCRADVIEAVAVARRHKLFPAVRCGGHSVSGKGICDGGLTIDLGGMRQVVVDASRELVHADGGCLLSDVDAATAPHGLVVPSGTMSETGLGGLALGGGFGWLSRKYGLTCDHFVSLEVVLASGQVIEVSNSDHPELFWALRGGGGNFGIVTRFTFKARRFGPLIRLGVSLVSPEDAADALRQYARIAPTLSRSVGWHAMLRRRMSPSPFIPEEFVGKPMLTMLAMWLDDADAPEGAEVIERLINIGAPRVKAMRTLPFASVLQKTMDRELRAGHRHYTKELHFPELATPAIDIMMSFWKQMPMDGTVGVIGLGGAIADVPEEASAFSNRSHPQWIHFALHWDDPAADETYIASVREAVKTLAPWVGRGAYANMLNFGEQDLLMEALGGAGKYAKLARIKAQYDPDNLFRMNHNIVPAE